MDWHETLPRRSMRDHLCVDKGALTGGNGIRATVYAWTKRGDGNVCQSIGVSSPRRCVSRATVRVRHERAPAELRPLGGADAPTSLGTAMNTVPKSSGGELSLFGASSERTISSRQRDLLDAATAIEMEDAREVGAVGYAARLWAQLSLPYKEPSRDARLWIRRNGSLTLRVIPGMVGTNGNETAAYPYGVLPRYVLTWMSTEAVRTQSPVLQLGSNLSDFMKRLGMTATGGRNGTITRLNEQMRRLLTSSMYVEDSREGESRWGIAGAHFSVASGYQLWYDNDDRGGENPLWGSTITLGDAFYESIISAPVPIDTRALSALAGSPLKIDLLVWLSHRLGYVRKPQLVPWLSLSDQFGSDYARLRDFKAVIMRPAPRGTRGISGSQRPGHGRRTASLPVSHCHPAGASHRQPLRQIEVAVDGGPADAELGGDLGDGPATFPVGVDLVVHLPGQFGLPRTEFQLWAADSAAGSGGGQAVAGSLGHQSVFELGDRSKDLEEHSADCGGGVDALVQYDQVDPAKL